MRLDAPGFDAPGSARLIFVDWVAAPRALKLGLHVGDVELLRDHAGDGH
jgi:hypothetical protein